ncbi:MAG: STAS domain-containing protein [bacterium]|nr:STAS domain-containing protein [bacterium]
MSDEPLVSFEERGAITVGCIEAGSVLDAMNVTQIGAEILAYVRAHAGLNLLLNFERVTYLSSAVLTELLKVDQECKAVSGTLRLCSLNKDIRKVFQITNLDKHFVIYDSVDTGIKRHLRSLDVQAQESAWDKVSRDT